MHLKDRFAQLRTWAAPTGPVRGGGAAGTSAAQPGPPPPAPSRAEHGREQAKGLREGFRESVVVVGRL